MIVATRHGNVERMGLLRLHDAYLRYFVTSRATESIDTYPKLMHSDILLRFINCLPWPFRMTMCRVVLDLVLPRIYGVDTRHRGEYLANLPAGSGISV
jgi:hypothetical protein